MISNRKIAAKLAREFYEKKIDFKEFCREYPKDNRDAEMDELFYLIEHEPKSGNERHQIYMTEINRFIHRLDNEDGFPTDSYVNWLKINDLVFERKLVHSTGFDLLVKIFEIKTNNESLNKVLTENYFGDFYSITNQGIFLRKFKSKRSWPTTRLSYLDFKENILIEKLKTRSSHLDWTVKSIDSTTFEIDTKKEKKIINVP